MNVNHEKGNMVIEWRGPRKADAIDELGAMANIELPLFPFGSAKIKFLPGPSGDLHDISLRTSKLIDKSFVYNSIPCTWEIRSGLTRRQYTLYKYVGRDRIEVGQFEQAGNRLDGGVIECFRNKDRSRNPHVFSGVERK